MTRLTNLWLFKVRGENPEPIPFPTQFCNMIYLQRFKSSHNNFSGFVINLLKSYSSPLIGQIPIEFTRLAHLEKLKLDDEPLLTGFYWLHFHLFFLVLEFLLFEGSFKNLMYIELPSSIISHRPILSSLVVFGMIRIFIVFRSSRSKSTYKTK